MKTFNTTDQTIYVNIPYRTSINDTASIIQSELVVMFDIDDTVVMEHSKDPDLTYIDVLTGKEKHGKIHKAHVEQIIKHKTRGYYVVAWSGNGYKHVEQIINALGIQDHVDLIMSKPIKHFDDLTDANDILKARVYLEDK
jgi:hypothetical protein